jgi:hypothetical protein
MYRRYTRALTRTFASRRVLGMRAARALAAVSLFLLVLGGGTAAVGIGTASAGVIPSTPVPWCSDDPTPPCFLVGTHDGTTMKGDPTWSVSGQSFTLDGAKEISFSVEYDADGAGPGFPSADLGFAALGDTFVIRLDTGTTVPRLVTGKGTGVTTSRIDHGDGTYQVQVTAHPVTVSGQCDQGAWPWTCWEWATWPNDSENGQWDGYLDGQVSDFGQWTDAAERDATYGMDYWTNAAATDIPPQVVPDPANPDYSFLQVDLANRRFYEDGVTLVQGTGRMRIPNSFLQLAYGIPNPATMTGSSLVGTLSGGGAGTIHVYQNATDTAMMVDFDAVTFPAAATPHARTAQAAASSVRALKVKRGVIVPTRAHNVHAKRVSTHRGRVLFDPASPRGARITGYQARCVRLSGGGPLVARASSSPVVMTGLAAGRAYDCRVRATSRAGAGPWSSTVRLRAHP